ncbi:alcohol dehydrogenase catalytic domain-containing protein [Microbacterium album]|uniref:Alcohol dehydrogenase n=1 Tax=Microbacterium album TaxID=2053191 RepID=A0A917IGH0_9MICO|nr:alcohol dehydrogenase catalytic domain-containing protein [Microbacterium album]GGH47433.1 alcohol dehydrogenase [Microbacterium album]
MKITAAVLERQGASEPFADSQPVRVQQLELDQPGPTELLVRITAAGVCHSDLSRVQGARECAVPMALGHEGAGIVEAVGSSVTAFSVGDQVTCIFMPRCGECENCQSAQWRLCSRGLQANATGEMLAGGRRLHRSSGPVDHHGGASVFATHAVVDQASVFKVPHEVPSEVAALLGCAVLTGGGAVLNSGRLSEGETVAIVGMGGVGLAAGLVAKAVGAEKVVAVDQLASKLEKAREICADETYTPAQALEVGVRADLVVECVGHPAAFQTAYSLLDTAGRLVTIGLPKPGVTAPLDLLDLVTQARSITGSYMGSGLPGQDIDRYVQLYLDGRLPIDRLISSELPLSEINAAMDRLKEGHVIRQIVRP